MKPEGAVAIDRKWRFMKNQCEVLRRKKLDWEKGIETVRVGNMGEAQINFLRM